MSRLPRQLLVEGPDDREIVYHLCNAWSVNNRAHFEVVVPDPSGVEALIRELPVRCRSGLQIVGVVVDADTDAPRRWSQLSGALARAGYPSLPELPPPEGLLVEAAGALPRLGVWQMPDNQSPGIIEDFLVGLIAEGDELVPRARMAVRAIPLELRRFPEERVPKAELHTWLAWQEEPGTTSGVAIRRRYLDATRPAGERFVAWLRRLFEIPTI